MKVIPNPAYIDAFYEIRLQKADGTIVADAYPMKFLKEDVEQALIYLHNREWDKLKDLSISPYVKVKD